VGGWEPGRPPDVKGGGGQQFDTNPTDCPKLPLVAYMQQATIK